MAKIPKFIILLYHKIGKYPQNSKFPGLYVAERDFARQIKYLSDAGYAFLTLSELKILYDFYYKDGYKGGGGVGVINDENKRHNKSALNNLTGLINERKRYAAITFDDGSKSVYSGGLKILEDEGAKATVFMVSGLIGGMNEWDIKNGENGDEMLNALELKEMAKLGVEIGAHTVTHPHLTRLSADEAYAEISSSKKALEDLLGADVNFFAYPYGDYNETVKELVEKCGFYGACITKTGIVKKGADFFALKRVAIRHNTDLFKFKRKICKVGLFY